jgi:hypothetical protein
MPSTICFVEDEGALNPQIMMTRDPQRFPGCQVRVFEGLDEAVAWCSKERQVALFVFDSRMYLSEEMRAALNEALCQQNTCVENILMESDPEVGQDVLTGAVGTLLVKNLCPDCRIIVVSAFLDRIEGARRKNYALNQLLEKTIQVLLAKSDPSALTKAIQSQLVQLGWRGEGTV